MGVRARILFFVIMLFALSFGFLHLFADPGPYNFERLHVFLFNLCTGGTVILFFSQKQRIFSPRVALFFLLALAYAACAFFMFYLPAVALSIFMAAIVESVRIERFSLFPVGFFKRGEPVAEKFHQASLLCLSLGLLISGCVILNNEYLHVVSYPKLNLDVFFLGFSFPVSLITLSLVFSFLEKHSEGLVGFVKESCFWTINLGVIIFFLFIIFENLPAQVVVTAMLFAAVCAAFFLYYRLGENIQQKQFLSSGMGFLVFTAITGIAYIIAEFSPAYTAGDYRWLLKLHAFASLYGWNLCGLSVIFRYDDFPIRLHSKRLILFHWLTAVVLAPLGLHYRAAALFAVACYGVLIYSILFSRPSGNKGYGALL